MGGGHFLGDPKLNAHVLLQDCSAICKGFCKLLYHIWIYPGNPSEERDIFLGDP